MTDRCQACSGQIDFTPAERTLRRQIAPTFNGGNFYLSPPRLCRDCRYQRRLAGRNEWHLYRRNCDLTGRPIISIYSPDHQVPVYAQDAWWGDAWDPLSYGRDFDFTRPFFAQFAELRRQVPRLSITNTNSENSEFTNQSSDNKNCYLVIASNHSEKCLYGNWYQSCLQCIDCYCVEHCELCYECVNSSNLYHCCYLRDCENCSFSWYSADCKGCSHVFGCHGLRNKSYYLFNQPLSRHDWEAQINFLLALPKRDSFLSAKSREIELSVLHKFYHGKLNDNFTGDYLEQCKQVNYVFNARRCWDAENCQDAWEAKDCFDLTETLSTEECGEMEGGAFCHTCFAINKSWHIHDTYYSELCFNAGNLFGCIGVRHNEFCILNKQYTPDEYRALLPRIIEHMRNSGEWGEFFPVDISPFGYNESVAQEYFPLSKAQALTQRFSWHDDDGGRSEKSDNDNSMCCEVSDRPFRLVRQELELYKQLNIPLPSKCPDQRRIERYASRNPRQLWARNCVKCGDGLLTSYAPTRPEVIGCESCYLNLVN